MHHKRPTDLMTDEYPPYYATYINEVPDLSLRSALDESAALLKEWLIHLPEGGDNYSYAEGKWTVKEVLQHIIDAERVFAYRALRIGRGDQTPMAGFEQDDYVASVDLSKRPFRKMIDEFITVRKATLNLFEGFIPDDFPRRGIASGGEFSVRAMGFIICGHVYHHIKLFKERYQGAMQKNG